jgi:hypothetical protein
MNKQLKGNLIWLIKFIALKIWQNNLQMTGKASQTSQTYVRNFQYFH